MRNIGRHNQHFTCFNRVRRLSNFDIGGSLGERFRAAMLQVLNNVQNAASQTGRAWALAYDMAEMPTNEIFDYMTSDWKNLVDQGITDDPRYLHHDGKPVLAVKNNSGAIVVVSNAAGFKYRVA